MTSSTSPGSLAGVGGRCGIGPNPQLEVMVEDGHVDMYECAQSSEDKQISGYVFHYDAIGTQSPKVGDTRR
jgi:hypothetical protein